MRRCEAKSDLPGNLLATKSLIGHGAQIPVWSWTTLDNLSKKSRNGETSREGGHENLGNLVARVWCQLRGHFVRSIYRRA